MIWGKSGRHAWTPPSGTPTAIINRLLDDAGDPLFPRFKCDKITGLQSLGEPADRADSRVGAIGEIPRRSYRRGKTITYEGWIQDRTETGVLEFAEDLRAAFADTSHEGRMDVTKHPLRVAPGDVAKYFLGTPLALEIDDNRPRAANGLFELAAVLAIRNHDGRYFADLTGETATITNTNTDYTFA